MSYFQLSKLYGRLLFLYLSFWFRRCCCCQLAFFFTMPNSKRSFAVSYNRFTRNSDRPFDDKFGCSSRSSLVLPPTADRANRAPSRHSASYCCELVHGSSRTNRAIVCCGAPPNESVTSLRYYKFVLSITSYFAKALVSEKKHYYL